MIDPAILALLRCPITRQRLAAASEEVLSRLNARSSEKLVAALLREDGTAAYPVRDGIPILLVEAAVPV